MKRWTLLLFVLCLSCKKTTPPESRSPATTQNTAARHTPEHSDKTAKNSSKKAAFSSRSHSPQAQSPLPLVDRGIFPDLDGQVSLTCPSWLAEAPWLNLTSKDQAPGAGWRTLSGIPLCPTNDSPGDVVHFSKNEELLKTHDADQDGIPDSIDILRGAKKVVLNGAAYQAGYLPLSFPAGDVPRDQGVCTDVIVRSLRNAGFDLQELVANNIKQRPSAYPMVKKPDPNIDHRRVRTLLPYFEANYLSLSTRPTETRDPFFPGDILFMNTLGDSAPEHMGIVSDRLGKSGLPLIVNNWTFGTNTSEMDLLAFVPVTHRFRITRPVSVAPSHQGLAGLLERSHLTIPENARQAISVITTLWTSDGGLLTRWSRTSAASPWTAEGTPTPVVLGSGGLGVGRGLGHMSQAPHPKVEGDKRSPAGVFSLGTAFGRSTKAPYSGLYPYRSVHEGDFWVDDPEAAEYNTWNTLPLGSRPPWSAERLTMYRLGLVVNHNVSPIQKGSGSAIFIHPWQSETTPTVGCTALPLAKLISLLGWLDEKQSPVLLQTAGHIF